MKYQKASVTNEIGIPKPIIILLNFGFNPYVEANIAPVIIGAIAVSIIVIFITSECWLKMKT
jgi:lipopolysaccharide export LptBFGC system permease protein LptF